MTAWLRRPAWLALASLLTIVAIGGGTLAVFRYQETYSALAREKFTMGYMRDVSDALNAYALARGTFPQIEALKVRKQASSKGVAVVDTWHEPAAWPISGDQRVELLAVELAPAYIRVLRTTDAWDRPLLCVFSQDFTHFTLLSTGEDGLIDAQHVKSWDHKEAHRDIVLADFDFISSPAGTAVGP
jgi:hypothetical protein